MVSVDQLRALNGHVTYNPLGVVKLRIGYRRFWHFYSEDTPAVLKENIHSHPYSFESRIIKGSVRHQIYHVEETDQETDYNFRVRGKSKDSPLVVKYENINYHKVLEFDTNEGDTYNIHHSVLHQIELTSPKAVTVLSAGPWVESVQFVMRKDVNYTKEELFQRATEAECWEIIEHILSDENNS